MAARLEPSRWQRIEQVLDRALALEPDDWTALLDRECAGDETLRAEVEAMLRRVDTAERFLCGPPSASMRALFDGAREPVAGIAAEAGQRVGPYRIVREIGRGGMSRVYLAERADGKFEQQVALKVMRPDLDRDIDHARFDAERQILAAFNHSNIARLLDAGTTDDGRPYVALENVDGQPIDRYCDEHRLGIDDRLALFLTVCTATQHAHRNLIVHRDLKPSNIFVSVDGHVKLLDFGLAKLLEPSTARRVARATRTGQRWMTPEYAAPEQVRGEPVTTLTDVYQLGVVLYELLTGRLPFGGDTLHELDDAIVRGDALPPSSAVAASDPRASRALRGDLDAIVLKALRKEAEARYASAEALADDLRRHRTGHPVLARRGTAGYLARRFIRRHRVETIAALGMSLSLLAGVAIALAQARHARAERDRAEFASRESSAVTDFLLSLFDASDPAETRGDTLTAGELVRRAVARVEELHGEPADQARMLTVTGRLYESLGRPADAYTVVARALAVLRQAHRADDLTTASTLLELIDPLLRLGSYAAADSTARQALAIQQRILGPGHPALAETLHRIAIVETYEGHLAMAEAHHRRALALRERTLGEGDTLTADSHLALGGLLARLGRPAEAEREYRSALVTYERLLGPNDRRVANTVIHIAYVLDGVYGRYADAEPLYRRALAIRRRAYGDGHPMVAAAMSDLSDFLARRGDYAEAIALAQQQLDIMRRVYGPTHPTVAVAISNLATTLVHAGQLVQAESLYRRAIELEARTYGQNSRSVAGDEVGLARLLIERGRFAGADSLLHDAIRIRRIGQPPGSSAPATAEALLGLLRMRAGDYAAADTLLRGSVTRLSRTVGSEDPQLREMRGWLAELEKLRRRSRG